MLKERVTCCLLRCAASEPGHGFAVRETESCGCTIVAACSGDADIAPCAHGDRYACQVVVLLCVRRDVGQQCPFDGGEEAQAIFEYVGCDPEFVGGFVLVV